ncbi:MAG: sugar-binding protein [Armatimonadota bacterium]|nr:sugar-binding protein [Armatimonadota bacterium]
MTRAAAVLSLLLLTLQVCSAMGPQAFALEGRSGDLEWAGDLPEDKRFLFDNSRAHSGTWSLPDCPEALDVPAYNGFVVAETFETAEWQFEAWVKLEGEGELHIFYPADGRNAITVIESPTDGWEQVSLHLRANPPASDHHRLTVSFHATGAARSWWDDIEATPLYQHRIPRVATPPVIDGDLSDPCWNEEASIGDPYWRMYNRPRDARMATEVWCCYDDQNLYAAFRCETPDVGDLVSDVTEHDGYAWRDDSAEIFFDIGHDHDTYYEYIVTPDEVVFDSKWFYEGGQWLTDWGYIGEWRTAIEPGAWIVEIRLALESYEERDLQGNPTGHMPLPTGDVAGILFSRNDRVVGEGMSHADCVGSFHEVHQYGHLVGFRPNRTEAYRNTALREVERLEACWRRMHHSAGEPAPIEAEPCEWGTAGLPEAIAELRDRIEAPAPEFDEWAAIREEIATLDDWLNHARVLLAPMIAQHRWPDAPWGIAVDSPMSGGLTPTRDVPELIELSAARGETEPVQLVLMADTAPGGAVSVQPSPLHGPHAVIPASRVRWYSIDEERLMPEQPVRLEDMGGIWWEIQVPYDAEPGVYRGEIATTDGEHEVALPVELTVHDFTLPETPSLALSAAFDPQHVAEQWHGERSPLGSGEYWPFAELLLRHRVMPREMLADLTRWGDGDTDFDTADRMLERARERRIRMDALIAARPAHLLELGNPGTALRRALRHWERLTDVWILPMYAAQEAQLPEGIRPVDLQRSVAAADWWPLGTETPPAPAALGVWAVPPDVAVGLGGDTALGSSFGAEMARRVSELDKSTAWRVGDAWSGVSDPKPVDMRMLGWLADDYGVGRVFWDAADAEDLCASGLLVCGTEEERLLEPAPTVTLKMLRDAVEDYEYLRILKQLNGRLGRHRVGSKLWRLQLANSTLTGRNRDMVMNVRSYNRDPEHLVRRRERIARQIERTRQWLRTFGEEGPLPGDPEGVEPPA